MWLNVNPGFRQSFYTTKYEILFDLLLRIYKKLIVLNGKSKKTLNFIIISNKKGGEKEMSCTVMRKNGNKLLRTNYYKR